MSALLWTTLSDCVISTFCVIVNSYGYFPLNISMITKADFPYSLKNVPIPSKTAYLKSVIAASETFIQNLRWKVFHLLKSKTSEKKRNVNTFGFKTPNSAPYMPQLESFEADLNHLVSNLEFHDKKSQFQTKLDKDVSKINKSNNLFIKADKTSNVYEVDVNTYKKIMHDNVTANYKKADKQIQEEINTDAKYLTEQLNISDRVEIPPNKEAYITLKDHKTDFPHNIKCRLINPAKSNIGIISKNILDNIINEIKLKLKLTQLKNTCEALTWFKNIEDKQNSLLLICDIVDFYPSISEDLFNKTIKFAEKHAKISELDKSILLNARQSLLHFEDEIWIKHTGTFDVTMGSYDGAQVSDLVGLFILSLIKEKIPELNFALYRDDGIAHHKKLRPQTIDRIRKKLHHIFNELGLKITVDTSLTKADFLDVSLNLHQNSFEPYRKPNNAPLYIHKDSNHPPHVLKNVPVAVNKRLTSISSSKELFNKHKDEYQTALQRSGFAHKLKYNVELNGSQCVAENESNSAPLKDGNSVQNPSPPASRPAPTPPPPRPTQLTLQTNEPPSITCLKSKENIANNSNEKQMPRRSQRLMSKENKPSTINSEPVKTNLTESTTSSPKPKNGEKDKRIKKNRKRNIIYWNPPFNKCLATNIGKQFLSLIDKHFPANHDLAVALNRHTLKLSYSTTQNVNEIISAHNKKILTSTNEKKSNEKCNCKLDCPLPGECRETAVVYKAEVNGAVYVGMTKTEVRSRIRRHRHSFKAEYKRNETALSKYVWERRLNLCTDGRITEPEVKWSILKKCKIYKPGQKNCDLCISEKHLIIKHLKSRKCINRKSDISIKCIHKKQFYYSEYKKTYQVDFVT